MYNIEKFRKINFTENFYFTSPFASNANNYTTIQYVVLYLTNQLSASNIRYVPYTLIYLGLHVSLSKYI